MRIDGLMILQIHSFVDDDRGLWLLGVENKEHTNKNEVDTKVGLLGVWW